MCSQMGRALPYLHNGSHHIEIVLTTEMGMDTIIFFIQRMKFCLLHSCPHAIHASHIRTMQHGLGGKEERKEGKLCNPVLHSRSKAAFLLFLI
jgi:hypothetical protein